MGEMLIEEDRKNRNDVWVPDFLEDEEEGDESDEDTFDDEFGKDNSKVNMNFNSEGESDKEEVQEMIFNNNSNKVCPSPKEGRQMNLDAHVSIACKKALKQEVPICKIDDVVKGEQTMGYNMDGPSVGNSGGILCVWDPRMFRKQKQHVSDTNVAIQGVWIPNAKKCLIISVYAPQEVSEKKMLWSYLNHVIDNWSGETIIMGDFNEVRSKEERYGSIFNDHYASLFNSFISSGGLVEVPLGGYHKPILLREVCHDYGPIPFRVFHYWFEWEGFDELVKDTWSKSTITDNNAISKFMKKLKFLKEQIRLFVRAKKESACMQRLNLKGMLTEIDLLIDEKKVDQVLLNKRSQVMNSLHDFGKLESMEIAQKAKIKWSIEGDENSKYFHGILNKKRNQTTIRGSILVNGSPTDEFHFRRGLKQGDPLSLFLFILVMESLHLSFQNVVDEGLFKGLRMNLQKSKLLGIDVEDEKVSRAAMKMGCFERQEMSRNGAI
ncbi:RNA-directed DNA polymerase, eukaryota [Tanacetum coccineum]